MCSPCHLRGCSLDHREQQNSLSGVLTCSALKQSYRELLEKDLPLVPLEAPVAVLAARMSNRPEHFMNPHLLQSQLDTLEIPADALRIDTTQPPAAVAREILSELGMPLRPPTPRCLTKNPRLA